MSPSKLIWIAIAFSTGIYAFIAFTVAGQAEQPFDASVKDPIVLVLYGLAVMVFIVAGILPRMLTTAPARVRMIVGMALYEACAVFALVAAFLRHDWRLYLAPWALAVIGFARLWPGSGDVTSSARVSSQTSR
ncbi:MAG: hypothetical protein M3Q69_11020 [Acidobacteriota bacterium]|nr:hypothetical protein [Acidobacteriota bacterium]